MKSYIGLDGHSTSCTFAVLDSEGREIASQRVTTSETGIVQFVRGVKRPRAIAFEESHMSRWLYGLLWEEVDELVVCHARFLSARSGAKTDVSDARHLAQQLRGGFLTPVFHEESPFFELRSLTSGYQNVIQEIVRTKNRYKALFRSEGHPTQGTTIYTDEKRMDALQRKTDRFVARGLWDQLKMLGQQKAHYRKEFEKNVKEIAEVKALASIPGISAVRANGIASIVCSPKRFANKHKFWSYGGDCGPLLGRFSSPK